MTVNAIVSAGSSNNGQIQITGNATGTGSVTLTFYAQGSVDKNVSKTIVSLNAGNAVSFTSAEKTKLTGIATGAEVNVNADWNASSGDAQIQNKPTIPSGNQIIDWTSSSAGTIHSSNIPTLNQNTSGSAGSLSSTLLQWTGPLQNTVVE